jgi:hypothetical protein
MGAHKGHQKAGGRVKGTPNKVTGDMKAEAWRVFNELQNDPEVSLLTKAKENPNWFYTVFGCRLLPRVIEGDMGLTISDSMSAIAQAILSRQAKPGGQTHEKCGI